MGYGGDLLICAAFSEYSRHTGYKIALALRPGVFELLCFKLFRPLMRSAVSPVFNGNPDVILVVEDKPKLRIHRLIDLYFERLLKKLKLDTLYGDWLQKRCYTHAKKTGIRYVYKDDNRFNYAKQFLPDRILWKNTPNAVAGILHGFLEHERPPLVHPQPAATLYQLEQQTQKIKKRTKAFDLDPSQCVVFEPGTNTQWFGDLRSWSLANWQVLIPRLAVCFPALTFVRIGIDQDADISNCVDLRQQMSFLEATGLIAQCELFIGTEGGLMHAARAVNTPAVILWGGVTLPSFAGYPDAHCILQHSVACAPCGFLGLCPHSKACLNGLTVETVFEVCKSALQRFRPGLVPVH